MTTPPQDDAFAADIRRNLERVDQVMSHVVADPATRDEFVRDPIGVLSRLGLLPRMTPESRDRDNRIFYAVLQNTDLVSFLQDTFASFRAENEELLARHAEVVHDGLRQGAIADSPELDMAAAEHMFRNPDTLRELYRLTLHDINNRRLLHTVYTAPELDAYIDDVVASIQARHAANLQPRPINGVGTAGPAAAAAGHAGVNINVSSNVNVVAVVNVGVAGTVAVAGAVEVALFATVIIPVVVVPIDPISGAAIDSAALGDSEAVRALATAGALLNLAGEVLVHANNFERG